MRITLQIEFKSVFECLWKQNTEINHAGPTKTFEKSNSKCHKKKMNKLFSYDGSNFTGNRR